MRNKQANIELLRNQKNSNDYLRQMPRRWDAGDVYSPHDMSPVEMQKWRKRSPRGGDVIDALGIRPLDMYKVCSFVSAAVGKERGDNWLTLGYCRTSL